MSPPSAPNFCSQCGASLSPGDAFCSQCGTAVDETARSGTGSTGPESQSAFRRRVEDLTVDGWDVKHDYGDRVVMVDRDIGSWGVHALLLVFTGGIGNLLYAWYNYSPGADRVELRADGTERYVSDAGDDEESDDSLLANPGRLVVSFFCLLVGFAILGDVSGPAGFFVGVSLLVAALFVLPPVRDRLENRESVTEFGRKRTTDEEVVDAPDVPCTACSRPVGTGVRRTFAEKFLVAGVPVSVEEKGENCYCRSCAQGDPFTDADVAEGRTDSDSETGKVEREL